MIKAYQLYSDANGDTHVKTGWVKENFITDVVSISFRESPPHSAFDWHNAPIEQYVITLSGTLQFETHSGERFVIKPGDILIALDTTGTAHQWKLIDDEPWKRAYVILKDKAAFNFVAGSHEV